MSHLDHLRTFVEAYALLNDMTADLAVTASQPDERTNGFAKLLTERLPGSNRSFPATARIRIIYPAKRYLTQFCIDLLLKSWIDGWTRENFTKPADWVLGGPYPGTANSFIQSAR